MNYFDNVYERLSSGVNLDDIAKEFTDALNQAKQKVDEDNAAKAKELAFQRAKEESANDLMKHIKDFCKAYYPNTYDKTWDAVTGKDVLNVFETMMPKIQRFKDGLADVTTYTWNNFNKPRSFTALDKFLRDNNLL